LWYGSTVKTVHALFGMYWYVAGNAHVRLKIQDKQIPDSYDFNQKHDIKVIRKKMIKTD
jgi:hypothetical protein